MGHITWRSQTFGQFKMFLDMPRNFFRWRRKVSSQTGWGLGRICTPMINHLLSALENGCYGFSAWTTGRGFSSLTNYNNKILIIFIKKKGGMGGGGFFFFLLCFFLFFF